MNDFSTIKVADFGLSAKYDYSYYNELDEHCGTLIFMAPEVAEKKEYSKSVDMFSIGIIMHMLLTGGKHPIYERKVDTVETYKAKLKKTKEFTLPKTFSALANNLFSRLTMFNSSQRYSVEEALNHPWITRMNQHHIPLTVPERMHNFEKEKKLKNSVLLTYFLSLVQNYKEKEQKPKEDIV